MRGMEPSPPDRVLQAYAALWGETDRDRRLALIAQCLTEDAEILGPGYRFTGHRDVSDEVERFHRSEPGARAVIASGFALHHDVGRFAIALVDPQGNLMAEGEDIVEFAADGRIARVITFWGALPPVPDAWPRELTTRAAGRGGG